jgi:hypothetical protein
MTNEEINEAVAMKLGHAIVISSQLGLSIQEPKETVLVDRQIPPYSTDIKAAWEIVESLIAPLPDDPDKIPQYDFELNHIDRKWIASFVDQGELHGAYGHQGDAETAPLAICKAFLALEDK